MIRWIALVALGCSGGGTKPDAAPPAEFPSDYASSYTQVRTCRASSDHDLNNVRVLVDPAARPAYTMRDRPFPTGAIVLKEEYDFGDTTCTGPIKQWTVMVKLADGSSATTLDWHWQKVAADRHVITDSEPRCYGCHMTCGVPPGGYAATCSMP